MRLVQVRDGVLEIRWTWLPYWLAVNPRLKTDLERDMRAAVLFGGVTASEDDLDGLHCFVRDRLQALFPGFQGLGPYLEGLRSVTGPGEP